MQTNTASVKSSGRTGGSGGGGGATDPFMITQVGFQNLSTRETFFNTSIVNFVPEPSTLFFLASGLAGLMGFERKKLSSKA